MKNFLEPLSEINEISLEEMRDIINELVFFINFLLDLEYKKDEVEF